MPTSRDYLAVVAIASLFHASPAQSQASKDELANSAAAMLRGAAALGEPMDRCGLNIVVGDDGLVLRTLGPTPLLVGERITSINGTSVKGMTNDDFLGRLRKISPSQSVVLETTRGGIPSSKTIQCINARPYSAALLSAAEAAAKKDFKGCRERLSAVSAELQATWQVRYWRTQCAILDHSLPSADEPTRVSEWIAGLIDEAQYVGAERPNAAQAVRQSEAYFRSKGQLPMWERLDAALKARPELVAAAPAQPDWARFKRLAESAVKARLIDPGSAQFEWPWGFIYGTWKPLLAKRVEGYWTCGTVNARNRLGGYVGSSAFVVVLSRDGVVEFVDIGSGRQYDLVDSQCAKSIKMLPPAPASMATAEEVHGSSIADELAKLASLRDRGILSESEFQAQKAKLLGETPPR